MASVGSLRVDLGLNSADFQAGMSKAETAMAGFGRSASTMGKAANDLGRSTAGVMQRQAQLGFQLQDLAVQIQGGANPFTALLQQGSQVQAVYSGQGGFMQAFRDLGSMVTGLVTRFAPFLAIVGGVTAGLGLMTAEINKTGGAAVGLGDVAVASFQVIADGIYNVVRPAVEAIGGFFASLWNTISPYIATAANGIIGGFVGAYEAIKATWAILPAALGDLAVQAAQKVLDTFTNMGQQVVISLNQMINSINSKFGSAIPTLGIPYEIVPGATLNNPFAGAAGSAAGAASAAFSGAQGNYLGDFMSAVGERARSNIAAAKEEVDKLGGSAEAANDNLKDMASGGLKDLADIGQQVTSTLSSGFADMFKGLLRGTTSVMDAIGQLLNKLADLFIDQAFNMLLGSLTGVGGLFGVGGGPVRLGYNLPGYANGTNNARRGLAWVGERGPELMQFGGGERVIPNHDLRGGGGAITVDVQMGIENGNLVPLITNVSGQVAGQQIKQNNKQLPSLMRDVNQRVG